MATATERRLTEHETDETTSNSRSEISSQDEVLIGFDRLSFDSNDEDLPSERHWHCGIFIPSILQFVGEPGLQDMISLVRRTVDYFQLFLSETIMQCIVDEPTVTIYRIQWVNVSICLTGRM